jgi:hypothetical protein
MKAINTAEQIIRSDPGSLAARTLAKLIAGLKSDGQFELGTLYALDFESFELALAILGDWRIDRYYAGKSKLFQSSPLTQPA